MLDIELLGLETVPEPGPILERLCALALASAGIEEGHVAIEFVDEERIADLNQAHRGHPGPTDVLSFPIDGEDASPGPLELGDVVICPAHTVDIREAVVHGSLHLTGMDHETDHGEMLAVQREILSWEME
jgi:probable rRNA maturation factor